MSPRNTVEHLFKRFLCIFPFAFLILGDTCNALFRLPPLLPPYITHLRAHLFFFHSRSCRSEFLSDLHPTANHYRRQSNYVSAMHRDTRARLLVLMSRLHARIAISARSYIYVNACGSCSWYILSKSDWQGTDFHVQLSGARYIDGRPTVLSPHVFSQNDLTIGTISILLSHSNRDMTELITINFKFPKKLNIYYNYNIISLFLSSVKHGIILYTNLRC